jgi:hypothetical protein
MCIFVWQSRYFLSLILDTGDEAGFFYFKSVPPFIRYNLTYQTGINQLVVGREIILIINGQQFIETAISQNVSCFHVSKV